ncbi:hypothetical protein BH11ARM2_BH11ARM2_11150 [soil metagenome]
MGIDSLFYSIGDASNPTKYANEVKLSVTGQTQVSLTLENLTKLPAGAPFYFYARTTNGAGRNSERARSDGIRVDAEAFPTALRGATLGSGGYADSPDGSALAEFGGVFAGESVRASAERMLTAGYIALAAGVGPVVLNTTLEDWIVSLENGPVVVDLYETDGRFAGRAAAYLDAAGAVRFEFPVAGTFDIRVTVGRTFLTQFVRGVTVLETGGAIPNLRFVNGDVNDDNLVDALDYKIVQAAKGKKPGDAGYNPLAVVDGNGLVNSRDLDIVNRNRGKKGT